VAVLFSRLSGYMAACLKALKQGHDVELLVFRWKPATAAPFEAQMFDWIDTLRDKDDYSRDSLVAELEAFNPDVILMAGWMDRDYLHAARRLRLRQRGNLVVAGCDTQWRGTFRQRMASVLAFRYLHPAIDVLWVSGERQRLFAKALGYRGDKCWEGYYACDWDHFGKAYDLAAATSRTFLYVGRFVEVKGLDILLDAYRAYRARSKEPWNLICIGSGPLLPMLEKAEGVVLPGFVQPNDLPALMATAGAFVLPSRWEPWGVVVQEAAAAGLPIVCSDVCGASVHLVREHYNGWLFESENAAQLAEIFTRVAALPNEALRPMQAASHSLSKQYTPARWAQQFIDGVERVRGESRAT
jgi:glycosyltransferase involved in cell wall biosynthesis